MFIEGDEVTCIYFIILGVANFVLPRFLNTPFIEINKGEHFGISDIVGSAQTNGFDVEEWPKHKHLI